jgi:phospholipase C
LPKQEHGQRPARSLPYDLHVTGAPNAGTFRIAIENRGRAGATLSLRATDGKTAPRHYTVEAGKNLADDVPIKAGRFDFTVHGPNGFLRQFRGTTAAVILDSAALYDSADGTLVLRLANPGPTAITVATAAQTYSDAPPRTHGIAGNATIEDRWSIASSAHWYDVAVTIPGHADYLRRFAGHFETGQPSLSDPAFGRQED